MSNQISLMELQSHLLTEVQKSVYPPGRRVQISLASLSIVHEHHRAMAVLFEQQLNASAFALVRPHYEALVKGLWLSHCAPDSQLEAFAGGRELKPLNDLTNDLLTSALPPLISSSLQNAKKKYYKVMSSFAHAGHAQLARWLSPDGVKPTYQYSDIQEISNFIGFMTIVATLEMARLSGNETALQTISEILPVAVD